MLIRPLYDGGAVDALRNRRVVVDADTAFAVELPKSFSPFGCLAFIVKHDHQYATHNSSPTSQFLVAIRAPCRNMPIFDNEIHQHQVAASRYRTRMASAKANDSITRMRSFVFISKAAPAPRCNRFACLIGRSVYLRARW